MAGRQKQGRADASPSEPMSFFLEGHYYEGGLRTVPLGVTGTRPSWAPSTNFVGFRNEFELRREDIAVEVSRFRFDNADVDWIGVFKSAPDRVYGDRKNHVGVGLWLKDCIVLNPSMILPTLVAFCELVEDGDIAIAGEQAASFYAPKHLPQQLAPTSLMPPELSGWPRSSGPLASTAILSAWPGSNEQKFDSVAEQILRMTYLPAGDGDEQHSRAVILVAGESDAGSRAVQEVIRQGVAMDLAAAIPAAVLGAAETSLAAAEEVTRSKAEKGSLETKLNEAQAKISTLEQSVQVLTEQVAESDLLRRLASIDEALQRIDNAFGRSDNNIALIKNAVNDMSRRLTNPSKSPDIYYGDSATNIGDRGKGAGFGGEYGYGQPVKRDQRADHRSFVDRYFMAIMGFLAILAIGLVGFVLSRLV